MPGTQRMRWAIGLLALPLVACGLTGTGLVAGRHASSAPRRSSSAAPAPSERPADISGMDAPRPRTLRADATRRTLQIGFVGASVTRGWYVSAAADAFPQRTSELLAQRGQDVRWTVVARPGATVDVADGWQPPRGENVVVVHIVSNDFLYGTPLAGYRAGYRALLAHVRRASPRSASATGAASAPSTAPASPHPATTGWSAPPVPGTAARTSR